MSRRNGAESSHCVWTYLPTASESNVIDTTLWKDLVLLTFQVFRFATSLWHQVDFYCEQYLKRDQRQLFAGSILIIEQRLQLKRLAVGLLLTTLGILAVTVLTLVNFRPRNTVPCASGSIPSTATILAASDSLKGHLKMGGLDSSASVRSLEDRDYQTVIGSKGNFSIQPVVLSRIPSTSRQARREKSKEKLRSWWRPLATEKWFLVCTLVVPLILIGVLETIQQMSDKKQGIAVLKSSRDSHTTIAYVPVFVMLLVAMMYESLNATATVFAPLLALHCGNAQAARSISMSLVQRQHANFS